MSSTKTKAAAVLPVLVLVVLISIHETAGAPRKGHNNVGSHRMNDVYDNNVLPISSQDDVDTTIILFALQNLVDEIHYMMLGAKNTHKLREIYFYMKRRGGKNKFMKYMEKHLKKLNSFERKNNEDNTIPPLPGQYVHPQLGLLNYGIQ